MLGLPWIFGKHQIYSCTSLSKDKTGTGLKKALDVVEAESWLRLSGTAKHCIVHCTMYSSLVHLLGSTGDRKQTKAERERESMSLDRGDSHRGERKL